MTKILLTGATGYVGGRLLNLLEGTNFQLSCLTRHPESLRSRVQQSTEVLKGDVLDSKSVDIAMRGVNVAYYLVHSMSSGKDFEQKDRQAAHHFGAAAKKNGVERIIYLGGLGKSENKLSPHLRSRHEVGNILRSYGVKVIELRASVVIGSGSLSFEMIRALVERLPVMITPRWVRVMTQPISIQNLLAYLKQAIQINIDESQIFEIGGTEQVSYGDLMQEYARQRGHQRFMIPVPLLTPRLSGLWLGLVTPIYATTGRTLVNSIQHPTVVIDNTAQKYFNVKLDNVKAAIDNAIKNEDKEFAQTRWCDAVSSGQIEEKWGGVRFGSRIVDSKSIRTSASMESAFKPIRMIGGKSGWYYGNFLWKIRGAIDLLMGGVGVRRGRRRPDHIKIGDPLDFWRVEDYRENLLLRLRAEMKIPGRAWLQFEVKDEGESRVIRQTAIFDPLGLSGQLYWTLLYPVHQLIFNGMLHKIKKKAEQ